MDRNMETNRDNPHMEKLYIIGHHECEYLRPFRISPQNEVSDEERVWAILEAECVAPFIADIEAHFSEYSIGAYKFSRSVDVAIQFLLSSAWNDVFLGRTFRLEIYDRKQHGYMTTFVRREMPKTP